MLRQLMLWTALICLHQGGRAQDNLRIWYDKPAGAWVEALPVGNGHLGAMVFGRPEEELIQLNESTLWSGGAAEKQCQSGGT